MSNLLVQNIKHTNNTTSMTVDSTGRILTPARPAFYAITAASSTQWVEQTHDTYDNAMVLANTRYNVGNCYNTSNYKFTAPITGIYYFYAQAYTSQNGVQRYLVFRINGTRQSFAYTEVGSASFTVTQSATYQLTASDTVEAIVFHSADTVNSYYVDPNQDFTYFCGQLVG
jgi:hypothetical protein